MECFDTFHRAVDAIGSNVQFKTCLVYITDVVIFSKNICQQFKVIYEMLTLHCLAEVTLTLPKCHFFQRKFEYSSHSLMPIQLAAASQNADAIKIAVFTTDRTQMRSSFGTFNKYRKFIKHFSKMPWPHNDYLRKKKKDWLKPNNDSRCV